MQPSFPCEKAAAEADGQKKSSLHSNGHSDCSRRGGSGEVVDKVQGAVQHPATRMIALSEGNVCTPVALLCCQRVNALCMRSQNSGLLVVPKIAKSTKGGRAFSHLAPKLWNSLPDNVRGSDSISQFKSRLKTHLFSQAFT
ncbi:hypothetical protein DPX16_8592 [Anabarilius grahami]|uniref:Uncharacterized protein n=1 Tax=Anabarilius grahami TaxID=495550 RepID=A0A3N0Y9D6_ANAGA|nr:hypothetical protein DPX16_8592 [Anabarilius grahami]